MITPFWLEKSECFLIPYQIIVADKKNPNYCFLTSICFQNTFFVFLSLHCSSFLIYQVQRLFLQKGSRTLKQVDNIDFSNWSFGFGLLATLLVGLSTTPSWAFQLLFRLGFRLLSSRMGVCTCKALRCQSQKQFYIYQIKFTLPYLLGWSSIYRVFLLDLYLIWTFLSSPLFYFMHTH